MANDPIPHWMEIAYAEKGQKEIPGKKDNPRILQYAKEVGIATGSDEIPWCSIFANWVMHQAGYPITKRALAKSWLHWGVRLSQPRFGCIVVFDRGGIKGHVGFFEKELPLAIKVFGGNQSDQVCSKWFYKKKVIGYFWPAIQPELPPVT